MLALVLRPSQDSILIQLKSVAKNLLGAAARGSFRLKLWKPVKPVGVIRISTLAAKCVQEASDGQGKRMKLVLTFMRLPCP